ncbi:amidase [Epidermidibacterium keratini]|uniref:Amidase n=1 Tax=Epidermidibacterium keratini TaxID=1891644 RepID=A0A7L4YIC6_9ACTN|nr:amidase family protein [Epidermidibacterium keratini]QHB98981.1 amidase [Epidermidibacterium keratini]
MTAELTYASAGELVAMMARKEVSAREVLAAHLARVDEVNGDVNAIVTLVPEIAEAMAQRADDAIAEGHVLGPLHGIPMAHKDNHVTAGIRTTFGSRSRADFVPDVTDLTVSRLQEAGCVTIGKTNIPEFVAGGNTFNDVFGPTRNPYDLAVTAGGSSGGAAAALATGMQPLADGNDFGGSLRLPAGYCNVIGLRSSAGRVPVWPAADGLVGLSVHGPMARTVDDIALMMSVIAGPSRLAPNSLDAPGSVFAAALPEDGLAGKKVAFSVDLGGAIPVEPDIAELVRAAARSCADAGADVVEDCVDFSGAAEAFRVLRAWAFEAGMGAHLDEHRDSVRASLYDNMLAGRTLTGPQIGAAALMRTTMYHRMREFLERYDTLLLPVAPLAAFPVDQEYPTEVAGVPQPDYLGWMESAYDVTLSGHPAISMPAGFTPSGTPAGVQFVGRHRDELGLLASAKGFETVTGYAARHPAL